MKEYILVIVQYKMVKKFGFIKQKKYSFSSADVIVAESDEIAKQIANRLIQTFNLVSPKDTIYEAEYLKQIDKIEKYGDEVVTESNNEIDKALCSECDYDGLGSELEKDGVTRETLFQFKYTTKDYMGGVEFKKFEPTSMMELHSVPIGLFEYTTEFAEQVGIDKCGYYSMAIWSKDKKECGTKLLHICTKYKSMVSIRPFG